MRRIAMWSGPRNISTAMLRAFENRADCTVIDEPFYAAYLLETGLDHPAREAIIATQPADWRVVAEDLVHGERGGASVFYQKHMTQHLLPSMDLAFTDGLENCFLIREPRRILASYARIRPDFSLEEVGFPQQLTLFRRVRERLGAVPPVIDSALTLQDPGSVLRQLCDRLGIAFSGRMLTWPAGPRASDGVWAPHWYAAVEASTGFAAPAPDQPLPPLPAPYEALCAEAEAIYAEMLPHAIRPGG
ncbi:sulfotransferase-like domain-containing protein [Pseudohaliea rubra]|uniref:Branched-chain-amino-acid aminotransferase-like protein 2 n=1 Tax=Pseudohaliea rubra DSM 19751 TaxID=1265313 RepID=A0A095VRC1_9GAMM|nr:HAD family hydrolase [Pseudohaliea rubra]KGE03930.1 hypothetical protein HRUBRA_01435 [Pseudohaliea rubra DSM 19751]